MIESTIAAVGIGELDTGLLGQAIVLAGAMLLLGMGEMISERTGVFNVGLEGMMLAGAFFSYLVTWDTGSLVLGCAAGVAGGVGFGVIMGLLSIEAKTDQIVAGVAINLVAFGLTAFMFGQIFQGVDATRTIPTIGKVPIPGLSDIPSFGPALFNHDPFVYLAFLLVPASWVLLYRTNWGLSIRAVGELPVAADSAGVSVRRVRWMGVLTASAFAGLGGAHLAIVQVGTFQNGITAGLGFLALVAVIFGRWRPFGVLMAVMVLGGANAVQLRVGSQPFIPAEFWGLLLLIAIGLLVAQLRGTPAVGALLLTSVVALASAILLVSEAEVSLPQPLWVGFPYAVALVVLGAAGSDSRMPSALTLPYRRGG
jgi:simple sugar transport system permease protein